MKVQQMSVPFVWVHISAICHVQIVAAIMHIYIGFQFRWLCHRVLVHSMVPCSIHMSDLILSCVWWSICEITFQTPWPYGCGSNNRKIRAETGNQIQHCWQDRLDCYGQALIMGQYLQPICGQVLSLLCWMDIDTALHQQVVEAVRELVFEDILKLS